MQCFQPLILGSARLSPQREPAKDCALVNDCRVLPGRLDFRFAFEYSRTLDKWEVLVWVDVGYLGGRWAGCQA
jgi:hypothetical protein